MIYPKSLSIPEAAKLLSCEPSTICRLVGFVPRTGKEKIPFPKLAKAINSTPQVLYDAYAGVDRLLTKHQTAAMLGLKPHCLNVFHPSRPTIVHVAMLGRGLGNGFRYSQKVANNHLTNPPVKPPKDEPEYAAKVRRYLKTKARRQAAAAVATT